MAADLTDLFAALYERYAQYVGERDAYTLTDGRFHRTLAPSPTVFPCIVLSLVGGDIKEMFSGDSLDTAFIQMSVFAKFENDASGASAIMRSLIAIFNRSNLWIPEDECFVSILRNGYQREIVENRTHIHISQDWAIVRQIPIGRPE